MTKKEAIQWVLEHDDNDQIDDDEMDEAFQAIFGHAPNAHDREVGVWSHLCAAAMWKQPQS